MNVSVKELEEFVVATQPDLKIIKRELSAFNIFNVLGIQHREIRHSNFLGWLFDPNESHQLGDVFLKALLQLMRDKTEEKRFNEAVFIELIHQDLSDTQVYRERVHNIDILVVNEKLGLVICIENKIYANFSAHQLEKYYTYVEKKYVGADHRLYVALTRNTEQDYKQFAAGEHYINITYRDILYLIKTNINVINNAISSVKESIHQYIAMTEKSITHTSPEVLKAREIYKKHYKELDFIISNKPDFSKHNKAIIKKIKKGELGAFDIIDNQKHSSIIRILPADETLKAIFTDTRFQSWNGDQLFCLELFLYKEHVWLKWCFGDIRATDAAVKAACQAKKERMVHAMKDFDCFKETTLKISKHSADPEKSFTGICAVGVCYYDVFLGQDKLFLDFLIEKFDEINTQLIQPWTQECIQKLTPLQ